MTKSGEILVSEVLKLRCEIGDSPLTSLLEQACALRGGGNPHAARVVGIFSDLD